MKLNNCFVGVGDEDPQEAKSSIETSNTKHVDVFVLSFSIESVLIFADDYAHSSRRENAIF